MSTILIRNISLIAATLCLTATAPSTIAGETGLLDGKAFVGEFVHKGKTTGDKDTISFTGGRFHSSACDRYGYGDAAYRATLDGDTIRFEAETQSARYGKLIWKGAVKGDRLDSVATMLQPGKDAVDNSAWGQLKR